MILLDTCALLWLVMEPAKLSANARDYLREHTGFIHVSAVSAFEIAQKHAAGKLELPFGPAEWFDRAFASHGLTWLPLLPQHAFTAATLPNYHRDPFDRLLIGTACTHHLGLLTPDPLIHLYQEASVLW